MNPPPHRFAIFRFFGDLSQFLDDDTGGGVPVVHHFNGSPSAKDRIEALGVPHTEVAHLRVDGRFTGYGHHLNGGEEVEVYASDAAPAEAPASPPLNAGPPGEPRFVVDVNLGRLAKLLRLMGFDALYRNDYDDAHVAAISAREDRILLTRDRRLLMRREVRYGYFVRSDDPQLQIHEVMQRFGLEDLTRPYHRCSLCNGLVHAVEKAQVLSLLQPKTRRYYDDFWQCSECGQVYWEGSHLQGLTRLVARIRREDNP